MSLTNPRATKASRHAATQALWRNSAPRLTSGSHPYRAKLGTGSHPYRAKLEQRWTLGEMTIVSMDGIRGCVWFRGGEMG
jgi:hypothetical protein